MPTEMKNTVLHAHWNEEHSPACPLIWKTQSCMPPEMKNKVLHAPWNEKHSRVCRLKWKTQSMHAAWNEKHSRVCPLIWKIQSCMPHEKKNSRVCPLIWKTQSCMLHEKKNTDHVSFICCFGQVLAVSQLSMPLLHSEVTLLADGMLKSKN